MSHLFSVFTVFINSSCFLALLYSSVNTCLIVRIYTLNESTIISFSKKEGMKVCVEQLRTKVHKHLQFANLGPVTRENHQNLFQ